MILTIARSIDWVTKVVVDSVALLALFTNNSLGCAMAPSSFVVTLFGLAITFACLTCASINRRSKEAFGTFFAMFTFSVILTRLVTFGGILGTRTMTIAHTIRTRGEMPRFVFCKIKNQFLSCLKIYFTKFSIHTFNRTSIRKNPLKMTMSWSISGQGA